MIKSIQKWFVVFLLIILFQSVFGLKVGYYDNYPLCYDKKGEPKGLFVDVLERALGRDFSKVRFIFGEFSDLMKQLENGDIDLLMVIAETKERQEVYSFNEEPVIMNWGVLISSTHFSDLHEINGNRVAVNKGDIYYKRFKELVNSFNINVEFTEFDTYYDVLSKVNEGEFKYGVVSRLSYLANSENFRNVTQTSYIFSPVPLKFATKKGKNLEVLKKIDKELTILKSSGELDELFNSYFIKSKTKMPGIYFILSVVIIASLGAILLLTIYFFTLRLRRLSLLYRSALEKLEFNTNSLSKNNENTTSVYDKNTGLLLLKKYTELSKREKHALSILAIEISNQNEKAKKIFEDSLLNMIRSGDFVFRNDEKSYIVVMYSYGTFVLGSFKRNLTDKVKSAGVEMNIFFALKIFNPEINDDIEKIIIDAFYELEKDKESKK